MTSEDHTDGRGGTAAPLVTPLLEARGICKHFGSVQALSDVDLTLYPGEVLALVGDNGAGKSTLVKCIAGVYHPDGGHILVDGEEVKIHTPTDATRLGIETVYQDLALCDNLDVVANMFLGREYKGHLPPGMRQLSELEMEQRAVEVLDQLHVTTLGSVRSRVAALSGGQRQSVAISRAVMWNSKVVILDEPTAALGVAQTAQVLELIRRLRDQGLGVIVITHNLHVVFEIADRILALRLGRNVAEFEREKTTPEEVVATILGGRKEVII